MRSLKTKVSNPKRYSLSKLRVSHAPPKRLIQTRPHMSTSQCGNICIMPPKCSRKERRRGFSNRSSVDAAVSGRHCVFLGESKSTLFGLPKVDTIRNHWLRFVHNSTTQMFEFVNLGEFKAGRKLFKKKRVNSDFALTIWRFWISNCKYVLILV